MLFRIFAGSNLLRTETIAKPIVKIGKLASSDVRLDDADVSRVHAVVETNARGEVVLIDVGSLSGSFVNGERVTRRALKNGDEITVGKTRIVVELAAPAQAAVAAVPMVETAAKAVPPPLPRLPPPPTPGSGSGSGSSSGSTSDSLAPRAIEIAAMLGDSVVAVKHLSDPRTGRTSHATRGLFAAAALALFVALLAFAHGVSVAAMNHRAYDAWMDSGNAAIDFQPTRLAAIWDGLAIFGFVSGLATLGWGLARRHGERRSPFFRVGRAANAEFPTDEVPEALGMIPLVAPSATGDDFVLNTAAPMTGEIMIDGRSRPIAELPAAFPIPRGARVRVELGGNTFLVSSVAAAKQTASRGSLDRRVLGFAGGSAIAHAAVLALFFLLAPSAQGMSEDSLDADHVVAVVNFKPRETELVKPEAKVGVGTNGKAVDPAGAKLEGTEGKAGTEKSNNTTGHIAVEKRNDGPPTIAHKMSAEEVRHSAVFAAIDSRHELFEAMNSTADYSNGLDERSIRGGYVGAEYAEVHGWGTGVDGTGPGGGGWSYETVGPAKYGTHGHGKDTGTDYKGPGGAPGPDGGRKPKGPIFPSIGTVTTTDVDPNVLRKYIHAKRDQLGYCYQKQLSVKPQLEGTVTAKFTIDAQGRVIVSEADGMDSDVASCVADIIRSIEFPKWGTIINVTKYPFIYHSAGNGNGA